MALKRKLLPIIHLPGVDLEDQLRVLLESWLGIFFEEAYETFRVDDRLWFALIDHQFYLFTHTHYPTAQFINGKALIRDFLSSYPVGIRKLYHPYLENQLFPKSIILFQKSAEALAVVFLCVYFYAYIRHLIEGFAHLLLFSCLFISTLLFHTVSDTYFYHRGASCSSDQDGERFESSMDDHKSIFMRLNKNLMLPRLSGSEREGDSPIRFGDIFGVREKNKKNPGSIIPRSAEEDGGNVATHRTSEENPLLSSSIETLLRHAIAEKLTAELKCEQANAEPVGVEVVYSLHGVGGNRFLLFNPSTVYVTDGSDPRRHTEGMAHYSGKTFGFDRGGVRAYTLSAKRDTVLRRVSRQGPQKRMVLKLKAGNLEPRLFAPEHRNLTVHMRGTDSLEGQEAQTVQLYTAVYSPKKNHKH